MPPALRGVAAANRSNERGRLGFPYGVIRLRALGVGAQRLGRFVYRGAGCVFFVHGSTFSVGMTDWTATAGRRAPARVYRGGRPD